MTFIIRLKSGKRLAVEADRYVSNGKHFQFKTNNELVCEIAVEEVIVLAKDGVEKELGS